MNELLALLALCLGMVLRISQFSRCDQNCRNQQKFQKP